MFQVTQDTGGGVCCRSPERRNVVNAQQWRTFVRPKCAVSRTPPSVDRASNSSSSGSRAVPISGPLPIEQKPLAPPPCATITDGAGKFRLRSPMHRQQN